MNDCRNNDHQKCPCCEKQVELIKEIIQSDRKSLVEKVREVKKEPIRDDEIADIPFGAQIQAETRGFNKACDEIIKLLEEGV